MSPLRARRASISYLFLPPKTGNNWIIIKYVGHRRKSKYISDNFKYVMIFCKVAGTGNDLEPSFPSLCIIKIYMERLLCLDNINNTSYLLSNYFHIKHLSNLNLTIWELLKKNNIKAWLCRVYQHIRAIYANVGSIHSILYCVKN